jgi:hypothetical protein
MKDSGTEKSLSTTERHEEREDNKMKTVREYIIEAEEKGFDVDIETWECCWSHHICGEGWFVWGEAWYVGEHEFDECEVVKVTDLPEGIRIIEVNDPRS